VWSDKFKKERPLGTDAGDNTSAEEDSEAQRILKLRVACEAELQTYLNLAYGLTVDDLPPDGDSIMRWWVARRHEKPTLPYLVEVFKQVYGKTMSSAVLENDFKMTAKMMPSDRNLMSDVFCFLWSPVHDEVQLGGREDPSQS
jgi:hypothetical protein